MNSTLMKISTIKTYNISQIKLLSCDLRNFTTTNLLLKVIPSKTKSQSSHDWLTRQINDVYVKKCRYDRYRCRSAYKLLEIDEKYNIIKPGNSVVDCGAAPGSWTQVAVRKMKLDEKPEGNEKKKGAVVAVDLQHFLPIKGATILPESDFTDPSVQKKISEILPEGKANVILSDMAPRASGTAEIDSVEIAKLAYCALGFVVMTMRHNGIFMCKVWDSAEADTVYKNLQKIFTHVKRIKPKASRADSSELFLLARGYKGIKSDKT